MIITSGCIKDMEITQSYSRKVENVGLDTSSISIDLLRFIKAQYLSWYLSIYRAYRISDIAYNILIPKNYLFMGLHNPYRTRKARVCVNLIGIGDPI